MDVFKKFFTGNVFSLIATIVAVITGVGLGIYQLVIAIINEQLCNMVPMISIYIIQAVIIVFLYVSYRNHSKNVMKGLIGSALALLLVQHLNHIPLSYGGLDNLFIYNTLALVIALLTNHFVINSDRYSRPLNIVVNQIFAFSWLLIDSAWAVIRYVDNAQPLYISIVSAFSAFCNIFLIVYVETKLDTYRRLREAAGWTISGGYPNDYDREANYGK